MFRGLSGFRFSKGNLLPVVGFTLPKGGKIKSPSDLMLPSHLSVFLAGHLAWESFQHAHSNWEVTCSTQRLSINPLFVSNSWIDVISCKYTFLKFYLLGVWYRTLLFVTMDTSHGVHPHCPSYTTHTPEPLPCESLPTSLFILWVVELNLAAYINTGGGFLIVHRCFISHAQDHSVTTCTTSPRLLTHE